MKQRIITLLSIFCLVSGLITAESVWTGNAAMSRPAEFDSADDDYSAASNSFPGGTRVEVTNPDTGKSVVVSIAKRLSQPGLFILLSPEASSEIGLEADQVLPVKAVVVKKDTGAVEAPADYEEEIDDPDKNPAAFLNLDSERKNLEEKDSVLAETSEDSAEDATGEELTAADKTGLLASESGDETPPDAPEESDNSENAAILYGGDIIPEDNVIYFLTPSDLKPPVDPDWDAKMADLNAKPEEKLIPVKVDIEELDAAMISATEIGSRYIQVGTYSDTEELFANMRSLDVMYPMVVLPKNTAGTDFRLLLGPITRDEVGLLLMKIRSSGYKGAFLYKTDK